MIKSFDIISITETKLNPLSVDKVDLANYNFFQHDSLTNAGGAGIYVNKDLQAVSRSDGIKFNIPLVESCWIELQSGSNKPNVIIGCIYRHPTANLPNFIYELDRIISSVTSYEAFIFGDMNIDFLNYDEHTLTEDYLNVICSKNFLHLITKATRITHHTATLIEHMYTNALDMNISSRIIAADVSDHLPLFCMAEIQIDKIKQKVYFCD